MPRQSTYSRRLYQRQYQKEYKRRQRLACIVQLGGKCVDCGETNPAELEFDHVRGEKQYYIGHLLKRAGGINNPVLQEELAKCDLRCCACHAVKDGRLFRDRWGEFKRDKKSSYPAHVRTNEDPNSFEDDVPF